MAETPRKSLAGTNDAISASIFLELAPIAQKPHRGLSWRAREPATKEAANDSNATMPAGITLPVAKYRRVMTIVSTMQSAAWGDGREEPGTAGGVSASFASPPAQGKDSPAP